MAALAPGDSIGVESIVTTSAAANGSFSLRVDPSSDLLRDAVEPSGTVNFAVLAKTDRGSGSYSFSRRVVQDPNARWLSDDGEAFDTAPIDVALRDDSGTSEVSIESAFPICVTTILAKYDLRLNIIGEVYTGPNATMDLKYLSGSSSTLGVGYSITGDYGSWSQSGTEGHSTDFEVNFPHADHNDKTVFESNFGWQKSRFTCAGQVAYYMRQIEFQGGSAQYTPASAPSAFKCTTYLAGSGGVKNSANAYTFTSGAKLGTILGIDLSSRTGFNTATKITFNFQTRGQLCGTDAYPPQAARIVAK